MLATYKPVGPPLGLYVGNLEAVCWQPTGPMMPVGPPLGLYVGNLQAACSQHRGPMKPVGPPLGLYVGNVYVLQVLLGLWTAFAAVCWQATGCMLASYRLYAGNLQVL